MSSEGRTAAAGRRAFLRQAGAATVAALAGSHVFARSGSYPIGVQMYAIQSALVKDFDGTLQALRKIGYRQVEPTGMLGRTPRQYRAALDAAGLVAPSAHILSKAAQAAMLDMATGKVPPDDAWNKINAAMDLSHLDTIMADMFEQAAIIGNEYLVLAELDFDLWRTHAGIDKIVSAFTRAGDLCQKQGLKFAWHPHINDYTGVDGKPGVEWVLAATDPQKVFVELDFFWATMARVDIAAFLKRHGSRIRLGHIKDLAHGALIPPKGFVDLNSIPTSAFEDVGSGTIDYGTLIPLARKMGMRDFFIERDQAPEPLRTARRSYDALRRILDQT
jgi:sugar phosphate isomerase/epimerase